MDLAVPVYIYIRLTFLPIYLANTNRDKLSRWNTTPKKVKQVQMFSVIQN